MGNKDDQTRHRPDHQQDLQPKGGSVLGERKDQQGIPLQRVGFAEHDYFELGRSKISNLWIERLAD